MKNLGTIFVMLDKRDSTGRPVRTMRKTAGELVESSPYKAKVKVLVNRNVSFPLSNSLSALSFSTVNLSQWQ